MSVGKACVPGQEQGFLAGSTRARYMSVTILFLLRKQQQVVVVVTAVVAFDRAGHSLGGFTAACSAIFFKDILRVTTFESPGLTSFYHSLARQGGSKEHWQQRVVNYLSVPNPINTCQRHLGLMIRWD